MVHVLLAALLTQTGCKKKADDGPDTQWTRFNSEDDVVQIEVGDDVDETDAAPIFAELHSSSGQIVIGEVRISPPSGPVGTVHQVEVEIYPGEDPDEAWYDDVGRVEFQADAGDRGVWTIVMEQDSANAGLWTREIISYGDADEVRTDTFSFDLYQLTPIEGADAPTVP